MSPNWTSVPLENTDNIKVPFFEDARTDFAPNYASDKKLSAAISEATAEFGKLSATVLEFQRRLFTVNNQRRHGYFIRFSLQGRIGLIRVAGLPMRNETPQKEERVRVQCLLNVRDWLKTAVTLQVFSPDTSPLIPYLLMPGGDGQQTVAEYILKLDRLPELAAPKPSNVVDGVIEPV